MCFHTTLSVGFAKVNMDINLILVVHPATSLVFAVILSNDLDNAVHFPVSERLILTDSCQFLCSSVCMRYSCKKAYI